MQWQHFSNHCGLSTPSLVVNKNKPILSLKLLTIANTVSSRNCFNLKTTSQSDFELAVNTNYVSITNVTRLGNLTTEICGPFRRERMLTEEKLQPLFRIFQRIFRLSNDLKGYLHGIKKLKNLLKEKFYCVFSEITHCWFLPSSDEWSDLKVKTHKTFFKPNNSGHLIISLEPMKNCFQGGWALYTIRYHLKWSLREFGFMESSQDYYLFFHQMSWVSFRRCYQSNTVFENYEICLTWFFQKLKNFTNQNSNFCLKKVSRFAQKETFLRDFQRLCFLKRDRFAKVQSRRVYRISASPVMFSSLFFSSLQDELILWCLRASRARLAATKFAR